MHKLSKKWNSLSLDISLISNDNFAKEDSFHKNIVWL